MGRKRLGLGRLGLGLGPRMGLAVWVLARIRVSLRLWVRPLVAVYLL